MRVGGEHLVRQVAREQPAAFLARWKRAPPPHAAPSLARQSLVIGGEGFIMTLELTEYLPLPWGGIGMIRRQQNRLVEIRQGAIVLPHIA
jgi:hypothetical protein